MDHEGQSTSEVERYFEEFNMNLDKLQEAKRKRQSLKENPFKELYSDTEERYWEATKQAFLSDDETLTNEAAPHTATQIVIDDWSRTGRGSHVNFKDGEIVPLELGRFLGRGSVGDVHETTIQGWKLAYKKVHFRRRISDNNMKEIEILKRLSHVHMIQLVGTYTQQKILGMLLYPVATCDLHTFFDDVEAWTTTESENATLQNRFLVFESSHRERLDALGYDFLPKTLRHNASPIYSKIGCLISAVAYLHDQKIRHKDLKPSNILLSRDRLCATDNDRGTPRYFSPEVAAWKPNGRASDMFSLGCVLLEILVLHQTGSLEQIRKNCSFNSPYHDNLDNLDKWLNCPDINVSPKDYLLQWEIRVMLSKDPAKRPTAQQLLMSLACSEISRQDISQPSLFGDCCRDTYISRQQHEKQTSELKKKGRSLLCISLKQEVLWQEENEDLHRILSEKEEKIRTDAERCERLECEVAKLETRLEAMKTATRTIVQDNNYLGDQLNDTKLRYQELQDQFLKTKESSRDRIADLLWQVRYLESQSQGKILSKATALEDPENTFAKKELGQKLNYYSSEQQDGRELQRRYTLPPHQVYPPVDSSSASAPPSNLGDTKADSVKVEGSKPKRKSLRSQISTSFRSSQPATEPINSPRSTSELRVEKRLKPRDSMYLHPVAALGATRLSDII
ncbi:Nn.00g034230.m01.CDS01 [Neocucurbitaria sp. VM-36]